MDLPRTLVVTNDFPPRVGGVQQYVWNLVRHLPSDRVARTPGAAASMRRALARARAVTAVSRWTARALRPAIPLSIPITLLPPAVDPDRFAPGGDGEQVRERFGLSGRTVVLCVSRLVPRKGQDVLIAGMGLVRSLVEPEAILLVVGDGPDRPRLEALAAEAPTGSVVVAGRVRVRRLPA